MRFMDTMSMHIACSGFTHEQRDVVLNIRSQENDLNGLDSDDFNRTIRPVMLIDIFLLLLRKSFFKSRVFYGAVWAH